jgi:short-subunit dehydrogenase
MERKRVIIVGASSGIGREIACKYVEHGCKVGITGRRLNLLQELQQQHPHQIFIASFDVTSTGNLERIQQLINEMGGLDLLIYNAGFGEPSLELDCETELLTTRTNVNGFVEIVGFAFNYFMAQGYGQIALTSSVAALRGNSWAPAYSASKAFMSNYAEGLNLKARKQRKDLVITDIRPGFVKTKQAKGNRQFWVASVKKAAGQIVRAIEQKKRVVYVTKRWRLVAFFFRFLPFWLYRRLT